MPTLTAVANGKGQIECTFFAPKPEWQFILENIKQIPGRIWVPARKVWVVPDSEDSRRVLTALGFTLPKESAFVQDEEAWKEVSLPLMGYESLRAYQHDAMRFFHYKRRCLISDPMGAGKTVEALSCVNLLDAAPSLVIATASTKLQWEREWQKWVEGHPQHHSRDAYKGIIRVYGKIPFDFADGTSVIINWDILRDWLPLLRTKKFALVIADEVQYAGNLEAHRTKAFRALAKHTPNVIALSGTPIRSRPRQFFPILNVLAPQLFDSYAYFLKRYCDPKHNGWAWTYNGCTNADELHALASRVMLRREKADILSELPEKVRTVVPLEIVGSDYSSALTSAQATIYSGTRQEIRDAIAALTRSAFDVKKEAVLRWIDEFLANGEKLVVMGYHRAVIEYMYQHYRKIAVRVDGSSGAKGKEAAKQKFIDDPKCKLFLGNIIAAGVGIDGLQKVCSTMAFVEMSVVPTDNEQAEDRLHRIGQHDGVNIVYLIAEGTIEEDIMRYLDDKTRVFDAVVKGKDSNAEDLFAGLVAKVRGGLQKDTQC